MPALSAYRPLEHSTALNAVTDNARCVCLLYCSNYRSSAQEKRLEKISCSTRILLASIAQQKLLLNRFFSVKRLSPAAPLQRPSARIPRALLLRTAANSTKSSRLLGFCSFQCGVCTSSICARFGPAENCRTICTSQSEEKQIRANRQLYFLFRSL